MIHYFTGTGNSYFIASQLATSLNLSLHALKEGPVEDRDPVVGIVFPVYFGDAPDFVTDALEGLTFPGTPYLFAVATSGTSFGTAFQSIDNALQKKGQHLAFAAHLAMVANSTPAVRQHIAYAYEKLVTAEKALPQLVQKIKDRTSDRSLIKGSLMASFFRTSLGKSLGRRWFRLGVDAARCVKCGLCVRLCPVGNLSLGMDAVHMGKTCTYCLACLHACPKQAITIRERHILKEDQYHHPNVPFTGR